MRSEVSAVVVMVSWCGVVVSVVVVRCGPEGASWCGVVVRCAGGGERNELGGDGECGSEPEGASEVRALVVVSAERGECGCGSEPEGASEVRVRWWW